jgi:hypothetical protein
MGLREAVRMGDGREMAECSVRCWALVLEALNLRVLNLHSLTPADDLENRMQFVLM